MDILNITTGVIIHQVNCQHVMGAGLALQIRNKYPQHYQDYMNSTLKLGTLITTRINNQFGIIGMCAQQSYGRHKRQTDYKAFEQCLNQIKILHDKAPSIKYYMPYKIGCGLAGGDWDIISQLITDICPFINIVSL